MDSSLSSDEPSGAPMHVEWQGGCTGSLQGCSGRGWQWEPEFEGRLTPAPAELVLAASFASPAGNGIGGRADIVCGLDFSPSGLFCAAGGTSKQVRG
jgi:hypothetical protein